MTVKEEEMAKDRQEDAAATARFNRHPCPRQAPKTRYSQKKNKSVQHFCATVVSSTTTDWMTKLAQAAKLQSWIWTRLFLHHFLSTQNSILGARLELIVSVSRLSFSLSLSLSL